MSTTQVPPAASNKEPAAEQNKPLEDSFATLSVNGLKLAGTTIPRGEESDGKGEYPNNTWSPCDATTFSLRIGPNYNRNKQKAPSAPALLDIVGVDCYRTPARIDDIGSKVQIPDEWRQLNTHRSGVPSLFIVNMQIPSEFPTSIFREITDGPGWSLVLYFRISEKTAEDLLNYDSAPPGVKLFSDYCSSAPEANCSSTSSPWHGRFKVTMRCQNIDEFGLPSFITSYNAKPVLIRNTGTLIRGDGYLEMDINVHRFASVPKKALQILMGNFERMFVNMGFCIESRDDSEMPEVMMGCVAINKPTVDSHPEWKR